ncbi:SDR family NAD(P)-dependent oxidoreductase [uncultured Thiodictyon sp.]|uniref:SDR family NAD(P)-dependent oxidoreductase n=1 Tax=uncultured Thiodictyon sp. TaxID=1846217 RepID=UPI0025D1A083|nr:SDR family NAD(P)-dependent oxidoreductase [uncultured Thiodictyon sp.]
MKVPVCVIVGAGPGNGAAFARAFSGAGYHIALLARGRDNLDALVSEIADARAYTYDATDPADAQRVFAAIREDLGAPQVLIYNASSRAFGDLDATSPDVFENAWRVNAYGCLLAAQQVVPAMRAAGLGNIVVIGATASLKGAAGFVAFAAAKAAQRSLAQSLARQLGPEGIHVSYVIIDAVVDTPGSRAMLPEAPDGFFAKPDDIAESVFFLTRQPRSA